MPSNSDRNAGLVRSAKLDRAKLNAEQRTIELAFSSETPVERWGELEVLSHRAGEYDFSRLNNKHPLLVGHNESDPNSQIGVIESARVDSDGVGRAVVRFSKSVRAQEIFQDVQDGIRELVSVGYDRTGIVESKKDSGGLVTTRYRWQPSHIAIVPVPADTAVGVGRAAVDSGDKTDMPNVTEAPVLNEAAIREDAAGKSRAATLAAEKERAKTILTACDEFVRDHGAKNDGNLATQLRDLARECLTGENPVPVAEFQRRAMTEILRAKPAKPVLARDFAGEEVNDYSLHKAIQSAARNRIKGNEPVPTEGREGEFHKELTKRMSENGGPGFDMAGFPVAPDMPIRANRDDVRRMGRDMQATVFNAGGAAVPTQLVVPIIELLRNRMVLDKVGIRVMAGLQGNIVIPRQEAAAVAYAVSEIGALTASQQVLGQIALAPKRVGAYQDYSKQLVFQSTPDIEAFMRDDLFQVIARMWDKLGLNGQGANSEPLGIINTPGVGSVTLGASAAAIYGKVVSMETALRSANVEDPITYVSTPATKGNYKTCPETLTGATVLSGAQNAVWKPDNTMNGYPAIDSNQVPSNLVLAGAWTHLIHALWGGLDITVDYYTKAINAEIRITINTWGDFAVRHPQAFVVSTDSGAQTLS